MFLIREYPRLIDYLGIRCGRCGSPNTFIEFYHNTGPEAKCWMCERRVIIPPAIKAQYEVQKGRKI